MHIALTLRMQSLRSKELTLLQTICIRRREIRRVTRQVLGQGEVSIGQVSLGEGIALIVGFGSAGV
jgi:tetrahydromethanopterin S-methyltransferase subunit C